MPTTFFSFFFCWAGGWGLHDAHKTHYAHTVKYIFSLELFFSFLVCVMDCGASQKGRRCFSFFVDGKRKHEIKQNRNTKNKRNGTVLYRRRMGLQKPKSGRSQMCVQKHWISLLEIINKKFSCFHFFSFSFEGGGYTSTQSIYSAPISQILSKIIIRFKKYKEKCI
jgi:hypothetical protein